MIENRSQKNDIYIVFQPLQLVARYACGVSLKDNIKNGSAREFCGKKYLKYSNSIQKLYTAVVGHFHGTKRGRESERERL